MRTEEEIIEYKTYLRSQIKRMKMKEYGQANRSLLKTYETKLETLMYLFKDDSDRPDRLSLCKWLAGGK